MACIRYSVSNYLNDISLKGGGWYKIALDDVRVEEDVWRVPGREIIRKGRFEHQHGFRLILKRTSGAAGQHGLAALLFTSSSYFQ